MKEIIKNTNVNTNGAKTYEEIKKILKGKDKDKRYDLAYEELMKLDREQCQNDCRYRRLYGLVGKNFKPEPYDEYVQSEESKKYFGLTAKCAQNYGDYVSLCNLATCYLYGKGTEIDEKKFVEYFKSANDSWYYDSNSLYDTLKDRIKGNVTVGDEIIEYEITFWSRDSIKYWGSKNKNYMELYTYKDLSGDELKAFATHYLENFRLPKNSPDLDIYDLVDPLNPRI